MTAITQHPDLTSEELGRRLMLESNTPVDLIVEIEQRLARLTEDNVRLRADSEALAWLDTQTSLEVHHHCPVYADDHDDAVEWRVTRVSGAINDREWETVGRGGTSVAAILAARQALTPAASEGMRAAPTFATGERK